MQPWKELPAPSLIKTAESLLTKTFGGPVRLRRADNLGGNSRSNVYRFVVLDGSSKAPKSVIVKQAQGAYASMLFNDWASLQFLQQLIPLAPRFYAGDSDSALLIMEDLGTGKRLDQLLLGDDPVAAEQALIDFATVHGRMHALSIGKASEYARIREALGPTIEIDNYASLRLAADLRQITTALSIPPAQGIDAELSTLATSLQNPGPFLAFIQGDSCPDNVIYTNSGMYMLDFEGGCFTHALLEGCYGHIPFPTCWCVYRLPERIPPRMEVAYRTELIQGCPAANDALLFQYTLVNACVYWALAFRPLASLSTLLQNDNAFVALSDRQRYLLIFNNVARLTEEANHLEAVGTTLRLIAGKLANLWPLAINPPYYPAFNFL